MRIIIENNEFSNQKTEIEIDEMKTVENFKYSFDEISRANGKFTKKCIRLIYQNVILSDEEKFVEFYKLCPNNEIWIGKLENYLTKDDVIVELFIARPESELMYLILNKNDSISKVKSIISRIIPNIVIMWNTRGHEVGIREIVADIDVYKGYYKLIIGCDDIINNTFDECCKIHDQDLVKIYMWKLQKYYWSFLSVNDIVRNEFMEMIGEARQILSDHVINLKLNNDLSQMPFSFVNSPFLFCVDVADRILDICYDYWKLLIGKYKRYDNFCDYFLSALYTAIINYVNSRRSHSNNVKKSMRSILIDAFECFEEYLNKSRMRGRHFMSLFLRHFLFLPYNESRMYKMLKEGCNEHWGFSFKMNGRELLLWYPKAVVTIRDVKKIISSQIGIPTQQMSCLKCCGGNEIIKDEDYYKYLDYVIEIVK